MPSRQLGLESSAARLQAMIRERGDYGHVHVKARAGHLTIVTQDDEGVQEPVARATALGGGQYGLSFRTHAGRWEPMPVSGSMEEVVQGVIDLLGPYLDQTNLQ